MKCRLCGGKIKKFLDLGQVSLPEEFRSKQELKKPVIKYPLTLTSCLTCSHIQLGYIVPADTIYKQNYFYDYSITKTGFKHWQKLAEILTRRFKLGKNDFVVDIGSNTGTLLSLFKSQGIKILGVDPSIKPVKIAKKLNLATINEYFTQKIAIKIIEKFGQAKLIACTNTFDHVDNLTDFITGITCLLSKNGVFVIEVPYFPIMLNKLTHIVYHQQIDYISLNPLINFFKKFNMEIFDCELIPMHGGSIRIYTGFRGQHKTRLRVKSLLSKEPILSEKILLTFAKKVQKQHQDLTSLLKKLKIQGKKIAGIGASAKGVNLLNYAHIDSKIIQYITEKSPLKIGRFTPSKIPIVSDNELIRKKPDYILLLAYNFQQEIIINLRKYKKLEGKLIIPVPKIEIK